MTEGELLQEFYDAWEKHRNVEDEDGAMTRRELEQKLGWPRARMHTIIRDLVEAGKWECVKVRRRLIDGSVRRLPAYRPVNASE